MPNIIEQQDLLKGLPDNRLAMMMQNPSGDIPPFLVAAEAQRRQAIRAQFSGGPQESVVDTLTKQMANVPQNIQAPAQMPPRMPPPQMPQQMPPQAAGVAALQAQQGMRDGGYVQRYADQGLVAPTVDSMAARITGMTPEEYMRQQEEERIAALGAGKAKYLLQNPTVPRTEAEIAAQEFKAATEGPFSSFYSPKSVYEAAQAVTKTAAPSSAPVITGMTVEERKMMQRAPVQTAATETQPRDPNAGQENTSEINKTSAREAELRKRQEELFGDSELSGWEKSQKWFAAAQAAMQPGQTNAQAVINALAALGGGFAEEKAAQRQSESEKEKAMLQWDLARYEADRAAAASAASDALQYKRDIDKLRLQDELTGKREINKLQTLSPNSAIDGINAQMKILGDELADPSLDEATRKAKQAQLDSLSLMLAQIMNRSGYSVGSVPTIEEMRRLAAGQ